MLTAIVYACTTLPVSAHSLYIPFVERTRYDTSTHHGQTWWERTSAK